MSSDTFDDYLVYIGSINVKKKLVILSLFLLLPKKKREGEKKINKQTLFFGNQFNNHQYVPIRYKVYLAKVKDIVHYLFTN